MIRNYGSLKLNYTFYYNLTVEKNVTCRVQKLKDFRTTLRHAYQLGREMQRDEISNYQSRPPSAAGSGHEIPRALLVIDGSRAARCDDQESSDSLLESPEKWTCTTCDASFTSKFTHGLLAQFALNWWAAPRILLTNWFSVDPLDLGYGAERIKVIARWACLCSSFEPAAACRRKREEQVVEG